MWSMWVWHKSSMYTWWCHQMEAFSALLAICAGNLRFGEFPAERPVKRSLMFSLICAWIKDWVNNCKAGDLRCHRGHYDVNVMKNMYTQGFFSLHLVKLHLWFFCKIQWVAGEPPHPRYNATTLIRCYRNENGMIYSYYALSGSAVIHEYLMIYVWLLARLVSLSLDFTIATITRLLYINRWYPAKRALPAMLTHGR